MHNTTERRKPNMTLVIPAPKVGNLFPIQAQIMLKARSKRHDKRNSRAKHQRQWRKEG
jgi:hypothetical protein